MANGILRFNTNSPVELALRWNEGKRVDGRYGEQVMYTLEDDRVMYVPPVVAKQIHDLGIHASETFEICKAELREDNKRWIEWRVKKLEQPRHPGSSGNVSDTAASAQGNASNHRNGSTERKQALEFQASADGTLLPVPVAGAGITCMELAMNGAAEIAQRVESRARMRNYSLQFTSEDIRAIGLTMFIQAMRERGVTWDQR